MKKMEKGDIVVINDYNSNYSLGYGIFQGDEIEEQLKVTIRVVEDNGRFRDLEVWASKYRTRLATKSEIAEYTILKLLGKESLVKKDRDGIL